MEQIVTHSVADWLVYIPYMYVVHVFIKLGIVCMVEHSCCWCYTCYEYEAIVSNSAIVIPGTSVLKRMKNVVKRK